MTGILPPTIVTRLAYERSTYQAGLIKTRIKQYPKGIPSSYHRVNFIMLSAYNPGGKYRPAGWNIRMMKALKAHLSRYFYIEGEGRLKKISEPLLLVAMDTRKGIKLARKFRQNAIVVIRHQRQAKLVYLA